MLGIVLLAGMGCKLLVHETRVPGHLVYRKLLIRSHDEENHCQPHKDNSVQPKLVLNILVGFDEQEIVLMFAEEYS